LKRLSVLEFEHGDLVVDGQLEGRAFILHAQGCSSRRTPHRDRQRSGSVKISQKRLKDFSGSFALIQGNFRDIDAILSKENIKYVDAVLLDLGISSYQIEDTARGFSIKHDSRLDMRMDQAPDSRLYDIINRYSEKDLSALIEKYGEERFHNKIARYISQARQKKPDRDHQELALLVEGLSDTDTGIQG